MGDTGQLVPQIESEGSAKELLQQIKEEKQRLVKGANSRSQSSMTLLSTKVTITGIGRRSVLFSTGCDLMS